MYKKQRQQLTGSNLNILDLTRQRGITCKSLLPLPEGLSWATGCTLDSVKTKPIDPLVKIRSSGSQPQEMAIAFKHGKHLQSNIFICVFLHDANGKATDNYRVMLLF